MQKIINFVKYNNTFVIILGIIFLSTGSAFASETVRDAVIGQTIEETIGVDNTALLVADLDSLQQEISITDTSEDEENYYINYSFFTFDINNNVWQKHTKFQTLRVPKDSLIGGKDLGLYVQNELSQIIDSQLAFLKSAKEKEQKKGETKIVKITKYTGLKGLVFNSETKELEGYEPVMKKEERIDLPYIQPIVVSQTNTIVSTATTNTPTATTEITEDGEGNTVSAEREVVVRADSSQPIADSNEEPTILIQGNNPAEIELGATYVDMGVIAQDSEGNDLSVTVIVSARSGAKRNDVAVQQGDDEVIQENISVSDISLDTSTSTTYVIEYSTTDGNGVSVSVERTVIVGETDSSQPTADSEEETHPTSPEGEVDGGQATEPEEQTATTTPEVITDTTAPIISLIGSDTIEIELNQTYTDQGATANDETDGDITENIAVDIYVDTSVVGTYTITYNVSDNAGNQADEVTRIVNVVGLEVIVEETASSTPEGI